MPNKLNYNRDKVWQNIVERQKKEKRKKFLFIWLFIGLIALTSWAVFEFYGTQNLDVQSSLEKVNSQNNALVNLNTQTAAIDDEKSKKDINGEIEKQTSTISNTVNDSKYSSNNIFTSKQSIESKPETDSHSQSNSIANTTVVQNRLITQSTFEDQRSIFKSANSKILPKTKAEKSVLRNDVNDSIENIDYTIEALLEISSIHSSLERNAESILGSPVISLLKEDEVHSKSEKYLFIENTLSFGSQIYDGPIDYIESRESAERLNFINSTSLGLEFSSKRNILFRVGLNVDIISHTYDHIQGDVIVRETLHDTAIIYNNAVVPGLRETQEVGGRHIVKNNEVLKFGIPIGLGYKWEFDNWSIRNYINAQLDFSQNFYGVIKSVNDVHLFDQEATTNTFYNNYWAAKLSGQILVDRHIGAGTRVSLGVRYTASEIQLSKNINHRHDYNGVGVSLGLSTRF